MAAPESLTKDALIAALKAKGVAVPPKSALKQVFIDLYKAEIVVAGSVAAPSAPSDGPVLKARGRAAASGSRAKPAAAAHSPPRAAALSPPRTHTSPPPNIATAKILQSVTFPKSNSPVSTGVAPANAVRESAAPAAATATSAAPAAAAGVRSPARRRGGSSSRGTKQSAAAGGAAATSAAPEPIVQLPPSSAALQTATEYPNLEQVRQGVLADETARRRRESGEYSSHSGGGEDSLLRFWLIVSFEILVTVVVLSYLFPFLSQSFAGYRAAPLSLSNNPATAVLEALAAFARSFVSGPPVTYCDTGAAGEAALNCTPCPAGATCANGLIKVN